VQSNQIDLSFLIHSNLNMVNGETDKTSLAKIADSSGYLESLIHSYLIDTKTSLAKIAEISRYSKARELRLQLGEDLLKFCQGKLQIETLCRRYNSLIGDETDIYLATAIIHSQLSSESRLFRGENMLLEDMNKAIPKLQEKFQKTRDVSVECASKT